MKHGTIPIISNKSVIIKTTLNFRFGRQAGKRNLLNLIALVGILFSFSGFATAQSSTDQSNIKFTRGSVSDSATFSMGVPLGQYPGRGLDLPISLSYSSTVWRIEHLADVQNKFAYPGSSVKQSVTEAIYAEHSAAGWKSTLELPKIEYPKGNEAYDYKGKPSKSWNYRIAKVFIHLPDGSTHELRKSDYFYTGSSLDMTGTFYAVDGSRMRFDATGQADTGTLYLPDGTKYILGHPTSSIIDRNGNIQTYNENTRVWTDTLGRPIENPLRATPVVEDRQYTLPGLNGSLNYTLKWRNLADALTPDANGNTPTQKVMASHYLPYPSIAPTNSDTGGNFPQPQSTAGLFQAAVPAPEDPSEVNNFEVPTIVVGKGQSQGATFNPVVLTEVILPNGASYKFSYNVYGEIDKVVYPTGAYEKYVYVSGVTEFDTHSLPYTEASRKIQSRKLSVDGTGGDIAEWTYTETADWVGGTNNNPLPDSSGHRLMTITAPDNTKTEIYTDNPITPADIAGRSYWTFGLATSRQGTVMQKNFYLSSGAIARREITQYAQTIRSYTYTAAGINPTYTKTYYAYRNPRPDKTVSIIFEGDGSALAQAQVFGYDMTNEMTTGVDQTSVATYHYAVVDFETAKTAKINLIPTGTLANTVTTAYKNDADYQSLNILGLPISVTVSDASGTVSKVEASYDDYTLPPGTVNGWQDPQTTVRGNATKTLAYYDIANSQYVETQTNYDRFGNPTSVTDGRGNTTTTAYETTYYAFPNTITTPIPGQNGSSTAFVTTMNYNAATGLLMSSTDANGKTTQMEYDNFLRPKKVIAPNGHQTITEYGTPDANGQLSAAQRFVKVKTQIDQTKWKEGYTWFDGLGRTVKTQSVDSNGDVFTETQYDTMGRAKKASNPYRAGETVYWTENFYDDLSRVVKVKTLADNAEINTSYSLATTGSQIGTVVTVTDQASKQRRSITNSLGQLTRVDEPTDAGGLGTIDAPNQPTDYIYDVLGNLKTVQQIGTSTAQCGGTLTSCTQTRNFEYDALSRLKSAQNPESGTISYIYDNNGNLTSKTDARGTTTYVYDNLNRAAQRSYSDAVTPTVNYFYDNVTNGKGKLTKVASTVSVTEYTSFDVMGRVTSHQQTTDGTAYTTAYVYNLAGALIEETYPSTRVVKYDLDADGDLARVQSKKNANSGFWNYADNFSYTAAGAVKSMQLGNGKWESTVFNSRLQPTQIALGTTLGGTDKLKLDFDYGTNQNNGNVISQQITVPTLGAAAGFTATQGYNYDSLNRLQSAEETTPSQQGWKQTYKYDRYGNRRFNTDNPAATTTLEANCQQVVCNPTIDPLTNKLIDYTYDNAGNTTVDAQGRTFTYDGENKQTKVVSGGQTVGEYFYDGDGKRVKKYIPSTGETTLFIYDASGKLVAEYATTVEPAATAQVSYLTNDHLGSPRMTTDKDGKVFSRRDFMPFGEEITSTQTAQRNINLNYGSDDVRQKFTSYERDTETDLDFAQARYYKPSHGRFTSVDPLMASARKVNPQTFNRYSYVLNNPYRLIDPSGMKPCPPDEQCEIIDGVETIIDRGPPIEINTNLDNGTCADCQSPVAGFQAPIAIPEVAPPPTVPPAVAAPGVGRVILSTVGRVALTTLVAPAIVIGILAGTAQSPTTGRPPATTTTTTDDDELDRNLVIVRGGESPLPPPGTIFSGASGATVPDAAAYVPHGQIRSTTVRAIMDSGGTVVQVPEMTRGGYMNYRHVNITEGSRSTFSPLMPNPVPKANRIQ